MVLCRLLNTLTQALQSSGVDLSQASVSVQIELGKQANRRPILPESIVKVRRPGWESLCVAFTYPLYYFQIHLASIIVHEL